MRLIDSCKFHGPAPDLPELPAVAIRELIANAIVHRDLSNASFGAFTQVVKAPSKLILSNPGGLWGITERQLGKTGYVRNPVLLDMCSAYWSSLDRGACTGIPAARQALAEAFLPEPYLRDKVVQFQAILTPLSILSAEQLQWLNEIPGAATLTAAQKHALVTMKSGKPMTNATYPGMFPMDSTQVRSELQELVQFGLAELKGTGRAVEYYYKMAGGEPLRKATSSGEKKHISMQEKQQGILGALARADRSLTKQQLQNETGLSTDQQKAAVPPSFGTPARSCLARALFA
ncbi:hypothetical protein CGERO_10210 [Corynebacterium gerontici]|uniref:Uncharacterized protein n=1 Tax=Corynebacterium gerontici TaxID=2079234 RepID=A0A3G6J2S5_9CORY|nr:hypothetical protein CGERO_10210 [Corynebacterium gerontici]